MLCSYTRGYLGVPPDALGGWDAPARGFEASPWAWQWSERMMTQQVCAAFQTPPTQCTERASLWQGPFVHHSCTASIPQPQVQSTYAVGQAPPTFSRVVGGPAPNAKRPEIICPQPTHPLPKWINMTGWEDDEDETTAEEGEEGSDLTPEILDDEVDWEGEEWFEEDRDASRRFLPSFIFSPDPEDLPIPFFPPSNHPIPPPPSLAPLSPDADDLPQPHFDSDSYSPISVVNSQSSVPGLDHTRSSWSDSFESIISPDPEDLPAPNFGIYDRFEVGVFKFPGPHDHHHFGLGLPKGLRGIVMGEGRRALGDKYPQRWLGWTRDR